MVALQEFLDFVAAEVGRRDIVPVPLSLVRLLGSAEGGVFVAQLLVWAEKEADADGWVARSAAEWQAATLLAPAELRAVVRRCRALGFLEVGAGAPGSDTRRYRLLLAPLLRALLAFLRAEAAGEAPLHPAVRRRVARRTVRLPAQAEPEAWRHGGEERAASYELREAEREQATGNRVQVAGYGVGKGEAVMEASGGWVKMNGNGANGHGVNGNGVHGSGVNGHGANGHGARGNGANGHRHGGAAVFNGVCWEAALAEMRRRLPARVYERWLQGSRFAGVEGETVVVEVENLNAAWWINTRLTRPVERAVNLAARGTGWLGVVAVSNKQ
jgi:hypothetical protein